MQGFYDTLKISHAQCPSTCELCVNACRVAKQNEGIDVSLLSTVRLPSEGFFTVMTCVQCGEPSCAMACPTGAIFKSEADGTVRIQHEKCIGCALCALVCPFGGITFDQEKGKAYKCDRCSGEPQCVAACKAGVLSFERTSRLFGYLRDDDPFVQGTGLCFGCPAEIALRLTLRMMGNDTFLFAAPGCACNPIVGLGAAATTKVPATMCLMTNIASTMTGVKRYYRNQGKDVQVLAFVGDGATADIGFQTLSGAAERGENIIYICYDNEAYMNTGIQRSGTTPLAAWTNTSPVGKFRRGKEQLPKNMPLLLAFHRIPYVATANVGYLEDYAQKLQKAARVKEGTVYIHLFSPCPTGWRSATDSAIDICRAAVETNVFPLWEAEYGQIRLTYKAAQRKPVREYLKLMGRYSHLNEEEINTIQSVVDQEYEMLRRLSVN